MESQNKLRVLIPRNGWAKKALIFNHHEVIHIINLGQMNVIPLNLSGCLYKAMNSKLSQTRMFLLKNNKK